jgi:hypothetical protein
MARLGKPLPVLGESFLPYVIVQPSKALDLCAEKQKNYESNKS